MLNTVLPPCPAIIVATGVENALYNYAVRWRYRDSSCCSRVPHAAPNTLTNPSFSAATCRGCCLFGDLQVLLPLCTCCWRSAAARLTIKCWVAMRLAVILALCAHNAAWRTRLAALPRLLSANKVSTMIALLSFGNVRSSAVSLCVSVLAVACRHLTKTACCCWVSSGSKTQSQAACHDSTSQQSAALAAHAAGCCLLLLCCQKQLPSERAECLRRAGKGLHPLHK